MDEDDGGDELVRAVVADLISLRGEHGSLTLEKFSRHPLLVQLCGDGDLVDGFIAFKRELERFKSVNKYEAAVAWSIAADADTVLDRLQATADALSKGEPKDQRTARHWSNRGMEGVARDLIAFAELRGHRGRDLVGVVVYGNPQSGLSLRVVQVASAALRRRAPLLTVLQRPDSEASSSTEIDLERVKPDTIERTENLITRAYLVRIELPLPQSEAGEKLISIGVMGRGSPTPTFFLEDRTALDPRSHVKFGVHRSFVVIDIEVEQAR